MNARVFLLVLVTAAFMAIWDADRPTEPRQIVAGEHDATASTSVGSAFAKSSAPNVATDSSSQKVVDQPTASVMAEKLIPLPRELTTGTWHAFNHEGDNFRITIESLPNPSRSPNSNATPGTESSADSCVVTGSDGVRWCFVRDESTAAN
jgi:hypothetical protein